MTLSLSTVCLLSFLSPALVGTGTVARVVPPVLGNPASRTLWDLCLGLPEPSASHPCLPWHQSSSLCWSLTVMCVPFSQEGNSSFPCTAWNSAWEQTCSLHVADTFPHAIDKLYQKKKKILFVHLAAYCYTEFKRNKSAMLSNLGT